VQPRYFCFKRKIALLTRVLLGVIHAIAAVLAALVTPSVSSVSGSTHLRDKTWRVECRKPIWRAAEEDLEIWNALLQIKVGFFPVKFKEKRECS
jgi:hypothetical protein